MTRQSTESETMKHLFFHSEVAAECWHRLLVNWLPALHFASHVSPWELFRRAFDSPTSSRGNPLIRITIAYMLWEIWKGRNSSRFGGNTMNAIEIMRTSPSGLGAPILWCLLQRNARVPCARHFGYGVSILLPQQFGLVFVLSCGHLRSLDILSSMWTEHLEVTLARQEGEAYYATIVVA